MKIGIYTGSFDPVTNGHLDLIERGSKMFDKLYVSVTKNISKNCCFTLDERVDLLKKACKAFSNVNIVICDKLVVEFAKELNANVILRGLRALTDFEYELQMATINKSLNPDIETVFMMTSSQYSFLSSSAVKELARFGGSIDNFVPENVKKALELKYNKVA